MQFTIPRERMFCAAGGTMPGGGAALTSQTAYCAFWGTVRYPALLKNLWLKIHQSGSLSGVAAAEIGLFSSPSPPAGAGQTLTKILAQALGDLTVAAPEMVKQTGGIINGGAGYTTVPGTHLWIVIRIEATGMGSLSVWGQDIGLGQVLVLAGASALTGISTIAGALPSLPGVTPGLYATLD